MATTKSTVVGIRLDHDRRAWVEGEAARLGVSVRGLFEGMIDEARSGGTAEAGRAIAGSGSPAPSAVTGQSVEEAIGATIPEGSTDTEQSGGVNAPSSSPSGASRSSQWSGIGSVSAVPSGLIREVFSLTASLIELSGRCATNKLGSCALTRRWGKHSL